MLSLSINLVFCSANRQAPQKTSPGLFHHPVGTPRVAIVHALSTARRTLTGRQIGRL